MRRSILVLLLAVLALPVVASAPSQACSPTDLHGWFMWHDQLAPGSAPYGRQLKMEIDGWYEGAGAWSLTIKRGTHTIVIRSPSNGAPSAGTHGTLRKGDIVTGRVLNPRGQLMFGNPGCVAPPKPPAPPKDPEGFICVASPASAPPPFTCSYIATRDGMYANAGSWILVIKRGCLSNGTRCKKIITIRNPSTPGGFAYATPGVIKRGDRVTGTLRAWGTQMTVGSLG